MRRARLTVLAAVWVLGCPNKPSGPVRHAELHKVSSEVIEIVPNEGQLPYCLVYTLSGSQVIRQLTMNRENRSFQCPAGEPIGHVPYRIPVNEGPVKVLVLFSDMKLNAGSIAQQLYELAKRPQFNMLDFRAPGSVVFERFDFNPEQEVPAATGAVLSPTGEVQPQDSGALAPAPTDAGTDAG